MKYVVEDTSLVAIANAIRAKTGKTANLTLADMPTAIASIETGGSSGGGFSFPTAEPGIYKHGTNFTELLYAFEDVWKDQYSVSDYLLFDYASSYGSANIYLCGGVAGDIIVPETFNSKPIISIYNLYCGNIVIPSTVTEIDELGDYIEQYNGGATENRCWVKTIYIKATTPPSLDHMYYFPHSVRNIVVPKGCKKAYTEATTWCELDPDIFKEADE